MKRIFIFLFCLFLVQCSYAQKGILKKADAYYAKIAYARAAENYEKVKGSKLEDPQMLARLANCYYQIGDTKKAEEVYAQMINDPTANYDDMYRYAMALKMNEKYEESSVWMNKFMAINRADTRGLKYKEEADYMAKLLEMPPKFEVKNLTINTNHAEFGGYADPNTGEIYMVSNRKFNGLTQRFWSGNNTPFLDMYKAKLSFDNEIVDEKLVSEKANTNFHDGPLAFHPDGHKVFFTRNNFVKKRKGRYDDKGIQNLKLYYADIDKEGKWINIREVPFNNQAYSVGHPAFSKDGQTMYFSSDMPGGYGGSDIYEVAISEGIVDMAFGTPVNMGGAINTEGQEMFPWTDASSNLFFASDGHPGFGGLDNYVVLNVLDKKNATAMNLGEPINSNQDDFAFIMSNTQNTGYVSSNRMGGKGDDDMYSFKMLEPFKKILRIEGVVADNKSNAIVPGASVNLMDETGNLVASMVSDENGKYSFPVDRELNYKIITQKEKYFDNNETFSTKGISDDISQIKRDILLLKDPGLGIYALVTDKRSGQPLENVKLKIVDLTSGLVIIDGSTPITGDILKPLVDNKIGDCLNYQITAVKEGYLGKSVKLNYCIEKSGLINIHQKLDIALSKLEVGLNLAKAMDMRPIYFDLNKSTIRKDARVELDKIVKIMNDYPNMEVELGSHTDCRGSYLYNEKLSDSRAKSSAAYIRSKITNPERIYGKGYGESVLLNDCGCEGKLKSNCSEEEHELNRRTEFNIVKIGDEVMRVIDASTNTLGN